MSKRRSNEVVIAREAMRRWSAREGKCPICRDWFRGSNCAHSVQEATDRLEENLIRAIVRSEMLAVGEML